MNHFINKCKHGTIFSQCRCPSTSKKITRIECQFPCPQAKEGKDVKVSRKAA